MTVIFERVYSGPVPPPKHERQRQVSLRMFYAALSKGLGKTPEECQRQVENGSIPCDCETVKKWTGFYPWEIFAA